MVVEPGKVPATCSDRLTSKAVFHELSQQSFIGALQKLAWVRRDEVSGRSPLKSATLNCLSDVPLFYASLSGSKHVVTQPKCSQTNFAGKCTINSRGRCQLFRLLTFNCLWQPPLPSTDAKSSTSQLKPASQLLCDRSSRMSGTRPQVEVLGSLSGGGLYREWRLYCCE